MAAKKEFNLQKDLEHASKEILTLHEQLHEGATKSDEEDRKHYQTATRFTLTALNGISELKKELGMK